MDIEFTEEQELLRDSVQKMLRADYAFDARQAIARSETGFSKRHWRQFAELGLLSAPFPEAAGGLGGGALAAMIVMEEFGRRLVVEPYFETVILAGGLLEDAGSAQQRDRHLPAIMSGEAIWALAVFENKSRLRSERGHDDRRAEGRRLPAARQKGGRRRRAVGRQADRVRAHLRGGSDGISLFIVDRNSANLHLQSFRTIDGRRAADVRSTACARSRRTSSAGKGVRWRSWSACATGRSRRSAPKRSAR